MENFNEYAFLFLNIIIILLVITYFLLLIIQSFINLYFNSHHSPKNIKELLFYEQFSYEIYSSINTNLILDLKIQDECEVNYQPLNFFLKLNPNYTFKYTVNITNLFNIKFCVPIYEKLTNKYNYFELRYNNLLKHSININDIKNYDKNNPNYLNNICEVGYKPCGILDTMNNILCLPKKYNCPLNDIIISKNKNLTLIDNGYNEITLNNSFFIYLNTEENIEKPIIITNFISFDKPWNHEYQNIIGKYKKGKEEIFDSYDIYMKIVPFLNFSNITLEDILKWEENNDYMKSVLNELNEKEKPNKYYFLFHKNYIGFKSYEEFLKFKKIFKEDDYKKSLQFGKYIPFGGTIIANLFAFLFILILNILGFIFFFNERSRDEHGNVIITTFINGVLSFIYFIIYISLYSIYKTNLKKFQFTLDSQMQDILNLYNKRMNEQILYDIAIYLLSISCSVSIFSNLIIIYINSDNTKTIKELFGFCGIC